MRRLRLLAVLWALSSCSGAPTTGPATRPTTGPAPGPTGPAPTATTTELDDPTAAGAPTVAGPVVAPAAATASGSAACRSGPPLSNVYHPDRLQVLNPCVTVTGTVASVRHEPDGDIHFDLALDPPYTAMLTGANRGAQHGWLVAEIVPADQPGCTPGQAPRVSYGTYDFGRCTGAAEAVPAIGSHVAVTGPSVLDHAHGDWAEIHPVWAIAPSGAAAATAPATATGTAIAGVQIVSVTSPVSRGATASLTARTAPNAACSLAVTLPSGATSASQGLGPATADASGVVQWSWKIGSRTTPGTATATVHCAGATATARFQIG